MNPMKDPRADPQFVNTFKSEIDTMELLRQWRKDRSEAELVTEALAGDPAAQALLTLSRIVDRAIARDQENKKAYLNIFKQWI